MKKIILVLTGLLLLWACKKEEENYGLPPATQSGEDTFGCLINGKPWVAEIGLGIIDPTVRHLDASFDEWNVGVKPGNHTFWISARIKNDSIRDILHFSISKIFGPGIITDSLFNSNVTNSIEYYTRNGDDLKIYVLDSTKHMTINIMCIDTIQNFISGTFYFHLKGVSDKSDVLEVSNGRFDAIYQPE